MTNREIQLHLNRKEWLAVRIMLGAAKLGENGDFAACKWNKMVFKFASQLVGQDYFQWLEQKIMPAIGTTFPEDELNHMRETAKYFS